MPRQPFAQRPHPDDQRDPAIKPHARRIVTVNLAESPLGWLHARGMVTDRQLLAGERLRADFTRAGLQPSVTMRWDAPPPDGAPRAAGSHDHASVARIDAHRRFDAAMAAAGAGLADICWRIICAGEAMPGAERALGWPTRSGRVVLALALDRLADHYRIG
jgi:hypothetical protein